MSELEKLQRSQHQKKRKTFLSLLAAISILLVLSTLFSLVAFLRANKETYAYYTENGGADYKVYLGPNNFYTEEYLDKNHAYIANLIDHIDATLSYTLQMNADSVKYRYAYGIETQLVIKDKASGSAIFNPTEISKPLVQLEENKNTLTITEDVNIDFAKYNALAKSFVEEYSLSGTTSELVVRMYVDVVGISEQFAEDRESNYVTELNIPLLKDTVNITTNATVVRGEQKILTRDTGFVNMLRKSTIIFAGVTFLFILALIALESFTRNNHIDYARKVKKLLSSYKSYIQKINNPFNPEGYQVLHVNTFAELLDIRDTLQMPVLMYENDDQTCSQFFIAAPPQIMYIYEVKVENLVISGDTPAVQVEPVCAYVEEVEPIAESTYVEAVQNDVSIDDNDDIVEEDSVDGTIMLDDHVVYVRYRKSYMACLIQAGDELKDCYSTIKNTLLSYEKVKSRISWSSETFNSGRIKCAKLAIRGKSILMNLNLDPKDYVDTKYRFVDKSDKKKYADVPFAFRVKSERSLKYAKELIADMMAKLGIAPIERAEESFAPAYEETEKLIERGLIKTVYSEALTDGVTLEKADIGELIKAKSEEKK